MDWCKLFQILVCFLVMKGDWVECQRCPQLTIANGEIHLRNRGHMAAFACNAGFVRVGAQFTICLNSGKWTMDTPICVGSGCQPPENSLGLIVTPQHNGGLLKFTCESGFYRNGPGQIYCDGRNWNSAAPTCMEGVSLGCDFETEGMCGWSQDGTDDFDWTRHQGSTPTSHTGPSGDHTTKSVNGHYIFIESSTPAKNGHKARLLSPLYQPQDLAGFCMQFFYHMLGSDKPREMGHLDVYALPGSIATNAATEAHVIFHAEVNKGNKWNEADIKVPSQTEAFRIIIQATRLRSFFSDIAVDDIKLQACPNGNTTDGSNTTKPTGPTSPGSPTGIAPNATTTGEPSGDRNASTSGNATSPTSPSTNGTTGREGGTQGTGHTSGSGQDVTGGNQGTGHTSGSGQDVTGGNQGTGHTSGSGQDVSGGGGGGATSSTEGATKPGTTSGEAGVRSSQGDTSPAAASTSSEILPIVLGILAALVIVVLLAAVIVYVVSRRQKNVENEELKVITKSENK